MGIILIAISYKTLDTGVYIPYFVQGVELGVFKYLLSFLFLIIGIYFIIFNKKKIFDEDDKNKYYKCPNCKETYEPSSLDGGNKCPMCKINVIDIDDYYK